MRIKELLEAVEIDTNPARQEQELAEKVVTILRRDCAPYLDMIGGLQQALVINPLWRGAADFNWDEEEEPIKLINVDLTRMPRDTRHYIHEMLNDWFVRKTGIAYRSQSIFCTGSRFTANQYATGWGNHDNGSTVIMIPVGNFNYCWSSEIEDLFSYLESDVDTSDLTQGKLNLLMNNNKYVQNTGLKQAIASNNEIMVNCNQVYIVSEDWVNYIGNVYK
jgi:hypothetical protein